MDEKEASSKDMHSDLLESKSVVENNNQDTVFQNNENSTQEINANFRICPSCNQKGLKTENGCDVCIVCGYSKCDK